MEEKELDDEMFFVLRIAPVSGRQKRFRIQLDGACDVVLYQKELKHFQLEEGASLSKSEYDRLLQEVLLPRAKSRILYLLDRQDRTTANLLEKLVDGGYPLKIAEEAVSYAQQMHYVDDERFARQYVSGRKERKSFRSLRMELLRHGIDRELTEQVLEEAYDTDENALMARLMEKKRYDPETAGPKEKQKMFRYLAYRGFSSQEIAEALRR